MTDSGRIAIALRRQAAELLRLADEIAPSPTRRRRRDVRPTEEQMRRVAEAELRLGIEPPERD